MGDGLRHRSSWLFVGVMSCMNNLLTSYSGDGYILHV